jgi:hypothetical protein
MFKPSDIVICTGWNDLYRHNGHNILDRCGYKKGEKLTIIDIMDDFLIFDNPSDKYTDRICLKSKHFTLLSEIRNNKIEIILT